MKRVDLFVYHLVENRKVILLSTAKFEYVKKYGNIDSNTFNNVVFDLWKEKYIKY